MLSLKEQALLTTLLTQPHRHYHNTTHIMDCLAELQQYKKAVPLKFTDEYIITYAIWYHDIVYNPYAVPGTNEYQSATIAEQEVLRDTSEIKDIILATAYHTETQKALSEAGQIMLDIDLSGLGKEWAVYMKNSENIRKEYHNTPDFDFATGRIQFLETMLRRNKIYYTDYFYSLYESNARFNMTTEIKILNESL